MQILRAAAPFFGRSPRLCAWTRGLQAEWQSRSGRGSSGRAFAWIGCVTILACQLDSNFAEFGESILDPDVRGIDAPGEQLLAGSYRGLRVRSGPEEIRYLLAIEQDGGLAVLNLDDRSLCRVPAVEAFGEPLEVPGRETVLPYISSENGAEELRFSRFDCESLSYRGEGMGLRVRPAVSANNRFVGLLAQRAPASLVLFDPWQGSERVLAEELQQSPLRLGDRYAWVDGGRVVVANTDFEPTAELGQRIVYLEPAPDLSAVAYVQETAAEGLELYVARLPQLESELVSAEVCPGPGAVRYVRREGTPVLAGLWPCELGRLQLFNPGTGTHTTVADNVTSYSFHESVAGSPAAMYTTGQGADAGLWLQRAGQPPELLDPRGISGQARPLPDGSLLFYRDYVDGRGQLMRWHQQEVAPVADSVRWVRSMSDPREQGSPSTLTLLANFDGQTGDLLRYDPAAGVTPVASQVPALAPVGSAFLSNYADGVGQLTILDPASGDAETVAQDVLPRGFVFAQQFEAVLLLRQSSQDAEVSRLEVHFLGGKRTVKIADGVSESREVAFPEPGFMYSVPAGPDAGVWFAEAL